MYKLSAYLLLAQTLNIFDFDDYFFCLLIGFSFFFGMIEISFYFFR